MSADVPLLILGGGCAGLSLAARLADAGRCSPRTLVLESRSAYRNDRTWCFWADPALGVDHLIAHEWRELSVRGAGSEALVDCSALPYQMLPSDRFYADAHARIAGSPRVELVTDAAVLAAPRREGDRWRVATRAGVFRATRIVDTRPQSVSPPDAVLWQSFSGEEIACEHRAFDSARVTLMDFDDVEPDAAVRFRYVLPTSPRTALIESTIFAPEPRSTAELAPALRNAVRRQIGDAPHRMLRQESGILPMGLLRSAAGTDSYVHAGLAAGAARPSTGYAFQRIQRWAARCAASLANGGPILGQPPEPLLRAVMDRIFLKVLSTRPELAPRIFTQLFARASGKRVARFLSDRGDLFDHGAVIAALPPGPFLCVLPELILEGLQRWRPGLPA